MGVDLEFIIWNFSLLFNFSLELEIQGQQILLKTASFGITLEGKNLAPVYEYLLEQRLVWTKEVSSSFSNEGLETLISSILIETE